MLLHMIRTAGQEYVPLHVTVLFEWKWPTSLTIHTDSLFSPAWWWLNRWALHSCIHITEHASCFHQIFKSFEHSTCPFDFIHPESSIPHSVVRQRNNTCDKRSMVFHRRADVGAALVECCDVSNPASAEVMVGFGAIIFNTGRPA